MWYGPRDVYRAWKKTGSLRESLGLCLGTGGGERECLQFRQQRGSIHTGQAVVCFETLMRPSTLNSSKRQIKKVWPLLSKSLTVAKKSRYRSTNLGAYMQTYTVIKKMNQLRMKF